MPSITIPADRNVRLKYRVPDDGVVSFWLEADRPVETYIVRPRGLEHFDQGSKSFVYYGGFPRARKRQRQEVRLPFKGSWYLIILNPSRTEPSVVDYEVHY